MVIIGAGASGLFCAAECRKRGRSVLVLDHGDRTAPKVRVSGGGRCNFTNLNASAEHYRSRNPHFCRSALARFAPRDLLALLEKHGVPWFEKEAGQLFCERSSKDMIGLLEEECSQAGVAIRLNERIRSVSRHTSFRIVTDRVEARAESLVVATGGLSYPRLGATGLGHGIAKQFGIPVVLPRPALVPFVLSPTDRAVFGALAGISLEVEVRCGRKTFRGGMLFTHKGLSGPVMLNASLYWEPGEQLTIDLLPGADLEALFREKRRSRIELPNLLAGHLPKRLAQAWCVREGLTGPLDQTSDKALRRGAERLHRWQLLPAGTEGYDTAEVTAGGVDTDALSSRTMEAKQVPGLYFIGEVVDVTGELGGYNLHWAWASGFLAGQSA